MKEKFGATSEKFLAYQQKQEKSRKDKAKCACECGRRVDWINAHGLCAECGGGGVCMCVSE